MLSEAVTVAAATLEPILLLDAKRFLRLDTDSLDHDVELMLAAARAEIEAATGLRLIEQLVEVRADVFEDLGHLPIGPVMRVAEIRYLDQDGAERTLDATAYRLLGGLLDRGVAPAVGAVWPLARTGAGAIVVRLSVGFGSMGGAVPPNLRWAVLALLRGKWDGKPVDVEPLVVNFRIGA